MRTTNFILKTSLVALACGLGMVTTAFAGGGDGDSAAHWSYSGHEGPDHWGLYSPKNAACREGSMQSPIDIVSYNAIANIAVSFQYKMSDLTILNNGHTVQVNIPDGSNIMVGGKKYGLLQVHFHTPSEHTVDGKTFPMEAHFVHQAEDKSLSVVGVFFEQGSKNPALAPIVANVPEHKSVAARKGATFDPLSILPSLRVFTRYMGSLTTPPCSEGVNWYVMKAPVRASKEQIRTIQEAMGANARPTQPSNNRLVVGPTG